MRKMCRVKKVAAITSLRWLSATIQACGPGRKDRLAWKATPSNKAKPRTASRA
jgi:hypothetical protein